MAERECALDGIYDPITVENSLHTVPQHHIIVTRKRGDGGLRVSPKPYMAFRTKDEAKHMIEVITTPDVPGQNVPSPMDFTTVYMKDGEEFLGEDGARYRHVDKPQLRKDYETKPVSQPKYWWSK